MTEVAQRLGVSSVLEGSIQLVGERLRVKVQLVGAADGFQLWAESYDRQFADVFAIQDEIADSVTRRFELQLGEPASGTVGSGVIDPATYALFLQGRYFTDRDLFEQAQSMFERVLEQEPAFVPAIAWLARTYLTKGIFYLAPPSDVFPRALEVAERAVELDADSPESHWSSVL